MMNYTEFVKEACSTLSFPANATTCFLGVEWDLTQNADLAAALEEQVIRFTNDSSQHLGEII
ncbi:MAG: hypothetical protein IKZ09_11165, partial [Clostridia bacterium]|nr:hypothetical protein [Clostridia bacterium]